MTQTRPTPVMGTVTRRPIDWARRSVKPRLYVHMSDALEAYYGFGTAPDYRAPDAVWRAYNKLELAGQLDAITRYLADFEGIVISPKDIRFSRKAGCSCPCSPGYIVENTAQLGDGQNIWLNLDLSRSAA